MNQELSTTVTHPVLTDLRLVPKLTVTQLRPESPFFRSQPGIVQRPRPCRSGLCAQELGEQAWEQGSRPQLPTSVGPAWAQDLRE